ncbi:MAG: IS1182 family transposase [Terriglobia bacterium]
MSAEQAVLVEHRVKAAAEPPPSTPPVNRKPRLKPVDRQQVRLQVIDPEQLVEEDHPVRAIWDLLGRLDLSPFCEGIKAVEGKPGRDRSDPQVLIALWLYAISRGVREARALDEWAQYEPGCQWLLGLGRINYHTLSDFVTQHAAALDELFVQLLQVLMSEGLADLERVAHDGTKIRATASRGSFKREERLAECRKLAEEHLTALKQQPDAKLSAARRQARQRAARERVERLRRAEEEWKRQAEQKAEAENVRASVSDPEARVMRQGDGAFAPSYNAQISTDARQGVILAYDVSQAQEDSQQLRSALERIEENTGRPPNQILVDGGYTTRQNILQTAERPTELIGSLGEDRSKNKLERHGVSPEFMPEHFIFDAAQNCFTCPQGKSLAYEKSKRLAGATEKHYRAKPSDCKACRFGSQCCPKMVQRGRGRLLIQTDEDPRVAEFRRKMGQSEYQAIYRRRAAVAEFSNACLKEKKGLRRFLRRGLAKVRAEAAWACLSCNVSIWIRLQWEITLQPTT